MKNPIISVVMPCFNASRYIDKAIESVLTQTFSNFEFIIINDGSTDETHEVVNRYKDSRINYINFKKNKGNYVARNLGIKKAKGTFICVMDSDDVSYPNKLSTQYKYMLKHPHIGCVGCHADKIDKYGNIIGAVKCPLLKSDRLATLLLMDNVMVHPSIMLRKDVLLEYNLLYDTRYKYAADFDFLGRFAQYSKIINIKDTLVQYRIHDSQISSAKQDEQKNYAESIRLARLKEFKLRFSPAQKKIYLKLMDLNIGLDETELEIGFYLLNKLLVKNEKLMLYDQKYLFELFDVLLKRNQLSKIS